MWLCCFYSIVSTHAHDRPGPCSVSSSFASCMYVCVWRRRWFLQNWSSLTKLFWTFFETGRGRRCLCGDVPGVAPLCPTLALVAAVVLQRLPDPLPDVVMVTPQPWCGRASATATTSLRCPVCARYRRSSMLKKIEDTCRATGLTPGQLVELVELLYV